MSVTTKTGLYFFNEKLYDTVLSKLKLYKSLTIEEDTDLPGKFINVNCKFENWENFDYQYYDVVYQYAKKGEVIPAWIVIDGDEIHIYDLSKIIGYYKTGEYCSGVEYIGHIDYDVGCVDDADYYIRPSVLFTMTSRTLIEFHEDGWMEDYFPVDVYDGSHLITEDEELLTIEVGQTKKLDEHVFRHILEIDR